MVVVEQNIVIVLRWIVLSSELKNHVILNRGNVTSIDHLSVVLASVTKNMLSTAGVHIGAYAIANSKYTLLSC